MLPRVGVLRRSGRGEGRWIAAGYGGLAGFFLLERLLRQPGEPASLKASGDDPGATKMLIAAYGLAVDAPFLAQWLPGRPLPQAAAPAGLVVEEAGLACRAWSMRALGRRRRRSLSADPSPRLPGIAPHLGRLRPHLVPCARRHRSSRVARRCLRPAHHVRRAASPTGAARLHHLLRADQEAHTLSLVARLAGSPNRLREIATRTAPPANDTGSGPGRT